MTLNAWTWTVDEAIASINDALSSLRGARLDCPDRAAKVKLGDYISALSRTIIGLRELAEGEKENP